MGIVDQHRVPKSGARKKWWNYSLIDGI